MFAAVSAHAPGGGRALSRFVAQARPAEALPADEELAAHAPATRCLGGGRQKGRLQHHLSIDHLEDDRLDPDAWCHIKHAAHARGVPPLRYVREGSARGQAAAALPPQMRARAPPANTISIGAIRTRAYGPPAPNDKTPQPENRCGASSQGSGPGPIRTADLTLIRRAL